MIDQSFSPQNIEKIFDAENKRGVNVERLFEDTFKESLRLAGEIKDIRKNIKYENNQTEKRSLLDNLEKYKTSRKETLGYIFEKISEDLKIYSPTITTKVIGSKFCYTLNPCVESFFYSKIIQKNLRETYKIKQLSRYHILKSVILAISDQFPKVVIRTDIKQFYESIPQQDVIEKLEADHLISVNTRRCIVKTLESYNQLKGDQSNIGLPRGIGISAYLSEIYMRAIDNEINKIDDLVYYARYVDDIIAIFIPNNGRRTVADEYLNTIKSIFKDKSNNYLETNSKKTEPYDLQLDINKLVAIRETSKNNIIIEREIDYKKAISYLGYKIGFKTTKTIPDLGKTKTSNVTIVDFSDEKIRRYKAKIKLTFEHYERKRKHNPMNSFRLLISRLKYLMSNTQLSNNKSNVYVGLYYSFPFVIEGTRLKELDNCLKYYIGRSKLSNERKIELRKLSFETAYRDKMLIKHCFENKIYNSHNAKFNDPINTRNKGIIKFGVKEITSIWRNDEI